MKRAPGLALLLLLGFGLVGTAWAQEAPADSSAEAPEAALETALTPAGVWTWTVPMEDQEVEQQLTLILEADVLSGHLLGMNGEEIPIHDATYSEGEVAFKISPEWNGETITLSYTGTLSEDAIVGQTSGEFGGEVQTWDWEAKRVE